jgi:hypothetical protein
MITNLSNYLYPPQLPLNIPTPHLSPPPAVASPPTPTASCGVKRKIDDVARVVLSRENSLKYSSQDYETYINTISIEEPLTSAELREMKRQRRLIKNREYAQTSRNKKKEQFEHLSLHIQQLTDINHQLSERVLYLEDENLRLREDNRRLTEFQQYATTYNLSVLQTQATTPVATPPTDSSPDVLDSVFSSDEEPSTNGIQTEPLESFPLSGMSCAFNSIYDNVSSYGTDIFGNFDLSQSMPATLFFLCIFFVLPFITITDTTQPKQFPIIPGEDASLPQGRALLTTDLNNQSPWPKDQFQELCKPTQIITMEDVYMDEQITDIDNNISSEIPITASSYLSRRITQPIKAL